MSDSYITATRFDGGVLRPLLSYDGFKDVGVEAIGVAKELGLPGARVGGLLGNKDIINAVRLMAASAVDIVAGPNQELAARVLDTKDPRLVGARIARELQEDILPRFEAMGWPVIKPKAGIDMVVAVPPGFCDYGFSDPSLLASFSLLRRFGVVLCPCSILGTDGRNYLRLVLKQPAGKIAAALDCLRDNGFDWSTDSPSHIDITHLQERIEALDQTRL